MLRLAFDAAVRDLIVYSNPALSKNRPSVKKTDSHARACWSASDARAVLATVKNLSPQLSAFLHLALDTGARKSELVGLTWDRVDLDAATVTIDRQLDYETAEPVFGPTKTHAIRAISLNRETVATLRAHRQAQNELKLRNRRVYRDFNLVFAKEFEHCLRPSHVIGQPLKRALAERDFRRATKAANVRQIHFHAVRHTTATLALQAGVPVHVVSQRLGHASVAMTLDVYAHALPNQQTDAAARLATLLHGR